MSKLTVSQLIILTGMVSSLSYGQTFTVESPQKKDSGILSAIPSPAKPMSAGEFKSEVNTKSQQSQADISKQVSQMLSKQPANPIPPLPNATQKKQPTEESASTGEKKPPANPPAEVPENEPVSAAPSIPPQAKEVEAPAAPSPEPSTVSSAPSTTPSQPYTGFGNGGSTGNTNSEPKSSGGGWNVKY